MSVGDITPALLVKPIPQMQKNPQKLQMTVSAIVPILNEERTIRRVIETLLKSPLIDEVICVIDDLSIDSTRLILKSFFDRIVLLDIGKNRGKGHAMCAGIRKAKGELIAFFDADITNLTQNEIEDLLTPIHNDSVRVVLGYPPHRHQFAKLFLPLTGERVYYREDLTTHVRKMEKAGYGVEVYLNTVFPKDQTKIVKLPNLYLLEKREKHGIHKSFKDELRATIQLSNAILKREGLLPEDYQKILRRFTKAQSIQEIGDLIIVINNKRIKKIISIIVKELFYTQYQVSIKRKRTMS